MAKLSNRLGAILKLRCPRCLTGQVFYGRVAMHEACPNCQHVFKREPGYFLGAMYVSYFMSIPILALLTVILYFTLFYMLNPAWVVLIALIPYILFIPLVFRYSRVIWMHIDPPPN